MKKLRASALCILSYLLLVPSVVFASNPRFVGTQKNTTWAASHTWLNINNISTQFRNDGQFDVERSSPTQWRSGFVFPKGSRKTLVYESGLLWGLKTDSLHVCGSTYYSGLQPGKILSPGVAEDPNLPKNRIYRVRPDYTTADLASEVQDEGRPAQEIRLQYQTDWNNWPATDGAPFDDRDSNGIYEPGIDIPGFKGADQTIWFVCNDLDTSLTKSLYGTSPVGMEMQVTIWAYNRPGALGNTLFKNYRLINRSVVTFDSMWVTQIADIDLGYSGDDYAGCDTTLGMTFGYNAGPTDLKYGNMIPPGLAFATLNAPMTAAYFEASGDAISWPPLTHEGTGQWYNWMRGLLPIGGQPFIHPMFPGQPTRFWLDGDPITGTGRVDGLMNQPGDRSIGTSTGPFTLMPGETKNIAIAALAGAGPNHLTSVAVLRGYARAARSTYTLLSSKTPPRVSAPVTYPTSSQATVQLVVDDRPSHAVSVAAILRRQDGASVSQITLYDDGAHSDSAANDGIWGNDATIAREASGLSVDVTVNSDTWERLSDHLTTNGLIHLTSPRVFSDNVNNDGEVNPGENIRYGFQITNGGLFPLGGIGVASPEFHVVRFNPLSPGGSDSLRYNGNDTLTYFSFTAPQNGVISIPFSITDTAYNQWNDTVRFSVVPFPYQIYGSPVNHVAGNTEWKFNVQVVNPSLINNDTYELTVSDTIIMSGSDSLLAKAINLRDLNTGVLLFHSHELPDALGHNMPVTDGFKIFQGTNFGQLGLREDSTQWVSPNPAWLRGGNRFLSYPQSAFNGGATTGAILSTVLGDIGSSFDPFASYPVEVRFDVTAPQKAYRLRRDFQYLIQSSNPYVDVPFTVWDVRDRANPRQLTVAWRDQNNDGTWILGPSDNVEFVFIYNKTYDATGTTQFSMPPNAIPNECTVGANADIMYGLALALLPGHTMNENPGTLYLRPTFALNTSDRFTFNPTIVLGVRQNDLPTSFELQQNYPNPFNPSTTIQYQLPQPGGVSLTLYNVLGQKLKTLVDGIEDAGFKSAQWAGTNDAGNQVSSGVYFYRIEVKGINGTGTSFVQTRKMLLIR